MLSRKNNRNQNSTAISDFSKEKKSRKVSPDANALMDSAESFKDEQAGILDEVLKASNQEKVIHQNL